MNREKFALWSFERDLKEGAYEGDDGKNTVSSWEGLGEDEKQAYLEEADFYLAMPEKDRELGGEDNPGWPTDILERMKKEG